MLLLRATAAASLLIAVSPVALSQSAPWATCPDGNQVETATAFGAPHLAGYGGAVTAELLQAAAFVALTRPEQRATVEPLVRARLQANGVQFDPNDWSDLVRHATSGVDGHATARALLYGLITGPLSDQLTRSKIPGILIRNNSGHPTPFARGAVELDDRACVLWLIIDQLIQSPCEITAGMSLYAAARGNPDADQKCLPLPDGLTMTDLRMAEGGGLKVSIAKVSVKVGTSVGFKLVRSAVDKIDPSAPPVWSGQATIQSDSSGVYAIIAQGASLVTDPANPFLVVDTTTVQSQGPVSCEEPTRRFQSWQLEPESGLHGPYATLENVIKGDAAGALALYRTGSVQVEWGFEIVRDQRLKTGGYYTTPPVRSTDTSVARPAFLTEDYQRSFNLAFQHSCENPSDFEAVAATVHTHPDSISYAADNFTAPDFDGAITQIEQHPQFEAILMIDARDHIVRLWIPKASDTHFSSAELVEAGVVPKKVDLWNTYVRDVTEICKFPPDQPGKVQASCLSM